MARIIYVSALMAAFGLKYFPGRALLYAAGISGIAVCLRVIFSAQERDRQEDTPVFAVSLFAATAVCAWPPFPLAAALAFWGAFHLLRGRDEHVPDALAFFASSAAAGAAVWWTAADAGMMRAALGGLAFGAVARSVSARLAFGKHAFAGEACGAAVLAAAGGMYSGNLAFLADPLSGAALAGAAGIVFHRLGMFNGYGAWLFTLGGLLIYLSCGKNGFAVFFVFTLIQDVGGRLYPAPGERKRLNGAFFASTMATVVLAVFSAGADDPFAYYFAMSGVMAAGIFRSWHRGAAAGRALVRWFEGASGVTLFCCALWMVSFIPPSGALLLVLSGFLAAFSEELLAPLMAFPERDLKWADALLGGAGGLLLYAAAVHFSV